MIAKLASRYRSNFVHLRQRVRQTRVRINQRGNAFAIAFEPDMGRSSFSDMLRRTHNFDPLLEISGNGSPDNRLSVRAEDVIAQDLTSLLLEASCHHQKNNEVPYDDAVDAK